MLDIVFLERNFLDVEIRRPAFAHRWTEYNKLAPEELAPKLAGADIVSVSKIPLRAAVLAQLPRLRMIAVAATGTDNVDVDYCRAHGIVVSNIRDYAVHSVPEHAFMLILALRRSLLAYRRDVEAGLWGKADMFCLSGHAIGDLFGSTLGIVGEGALGQGTAAIARGFGMRVLFADHAPPRAPGLEYTPLDELLARSDVVTLHCPLTEKSRNLIGARELALMKRSALLVNTARGGLVDEAALVAALQRGTIAGAGFDVLSAEPPRSGNALLDLRLPNLIVTPHVAWMSRGAVQALADQVIDNIEAFAAGAPRNVVT